MKMLITLCLFSFAVEIAAFGQGSPAQQPASPFASASVAATATASVSPAEDLAGKIHQRIEKRLKGHHGINIETDDFGGKAGDVPEMVIPLVGIIFLTVFGAPVLIVIAIMYFGSSKNRMMHRTIRMMVEKGQPVPAALLAPPTPAV